jgi:hypothetical protein
VEDLANRVPEDVARVVEYEMRLVREAIDVVAQGVSPRVTVAGLRLGTELLDPGRRLAREAGLRLVPLQHADDSGVDISIERGADEPG